MLAGSCSSPELLVWAWMHPAEPCCQAGCPSAGELAAEVRAAGCCYPAPACFGCLACRRHRLCRHHCWYQRAPSATQERKCTCLNVNVAVSLEHVRAGSANLRISYAVTAHDSMQVLMAHLVVQSTLTQAFWENWSRAGSQGAAGAGLWQI